MAKKKQLPVIAIIGDTQTSVSDLHIELSDLPVTIVQATKTDELNPLAKGQELLLILCATSEATPEGLASLNSFRDEFGSDAYLILINSKADNRKKSPGANNPFTEVLSYPLPIQALKNKIISHVDNFERRKELDLAITEISHYKKRLIADEHKIKILTNTVSEPIVFVDQNLEVSLWNSEAESFFGYSKYEVVNESFLRWLVAPKSHGAMKTLFADAKRSGAGILKREQSFTFRNKLGVEMEADVTLSYHKVDKGSFNLVFVIHDTSKERRLEKETQRAREYREENKLMRELLNHVNHELRTPLNAIVGISKTLQSYNAANLNERQKEGISLVQKSGEQLLSLIKGLLEISSVEANKLSINIESFDFDKLLAHQKTQTQNLIGKKKIKFVLKRSPAIPKMIMGDMLKINQILTNVVGNAVKFTTEGKIGLSSHLIDNKLYFEVTDTGIGIPKDKLTSIFEKFTRVKGDSKHTPGTGLGLHITKKLIELMSGEIKAESEKGVGTTIRFYITLPEEVRPTQPKALVSEIEAMDLHVLNYSPSRKLVLVIDDSLQNNFIYSILSEQDKYAVMLCDSSKKALSTVYEFNPDLIILKLEMPAIHGSSIIKELDRKGIKIPVVAFSEYEKYSIELPGNTLLLDKPISLETLFPILQKVKFQNKAQHKGAVIYEDENWLSKEKSYKDFLTINNKEEELSFIKLCQAKYDYLVFEDLDKSINGLGLFLKLLNQDMIKQFSKVILHHEATPMKYLVDKIASYDNVVLMTRNELLTEKL